MLGGCAAMFIALMNLTTHPLPARDVGAMVDYDAASASRNASSSGSSIE